MDSGSIAVKKEDIDYVFGEFQDNSVAGWLARLGLSAYIDRFQHNGYENLFQLDEFCKENLEEMNIPEEHRRKIWNALVEFHQANPFTDVTQTLARSSSNTSTDSSVLASTQPSTITSVSQQSQQSIYNPGYLEVTRYNFKHTVSHSRSAEPAAQIVPHSDED